MYTQENCAVIYACHAFCMTCDMLPKNCSTCEDTIIVGSNSTASQIYKVEGFNQCEVICPTGYFAHIPSKVCLSCVINCVNMTISNKFEMNGKSLNGSSLKFTYTFSEALDFSLFDWKNFLSFTSTNSSINYLNDFIIDY